MKKIKSYFMPMSAAVLLSVSLTGCGRTMPEAASPDFQVDAETEVSEITTVNTVPEVSTEITEPVETICAAVPEETSEQVPQMEITENVPAEISEDTTEETIPQSTEIQKNTEPSAPPETDAPEVFLDYGAAMEYGNAYAADTYGCVYEDALDWNANGTGYDYGGEYDLNLIADNGGQELLNRLMTDKVDSTFGAWRFPDGCAGIGVKCICYEDDGTVWFYVLYS